jgi:hypothetical protein
MTMSALNQGRGASIGHIQGLAPSPSLTGSSAYAAALPDMALSALSAGGKAGMGRRALLSYDSFDSGSQTRTSTG